MTQSECVEDIFSLISAPVPTAFFSAYADIALNNLLGTVSTHTSNHVRVKPSTFLSHILSLGQFCFSFRFSFLFVYSGE